MSKLFNTSSISFPNMLNPARNTAAVATDSASIVSRVKLLLLTEPTELYNTPTYGVGLKRYMFQYNNQSNIIALIKDRLIDQLKMWEPCVKAEETEVVPGLAFSGDSYTTDQEYNVLKFTVTLHTNYGDTVSIESNSLLK